MDGAGRCRTGRGVTGGQTEWPGRCDRESRMTASSPVDLKGRGAAVIRHREALGHRTPIGLQKFADIILSYAGFIE